MNRVLVYVVAVFLSFGVAAGLFGAGYVVGRYVESRRIAERREVALENLRRADSASAFWFRSAVRDSAMRTLKRRFEMDSVSRQNETERDIAYILDYLFGGLGD